MDEFIPKSKGYDVFISYSAKDRPFAVALKHSLNEQGVTSWIDKDDIALGEDWAETIGRALRSVNAMILIYSSNALESDNVKDELALAAKWRLAIIPIRIEDIKPDYFFEVRLARYNWVDVFEKHEEKLSELSASIKARIEKIRPERPSMPVKHAESRNDFEKFEKPQRKYPCNREIRSNEEYQTKYMDDTKKTAQKVTSSVGTDEVGTTKGPRITYASWDEYSREQGAKDPLKKKFLPIAEKVHVLLISTLKENNMAYAARYGDGTFSFTVPKNLAKSRKRTFVTFGLLNFKKNSAYIQNLYMEKDEKLPEGAQCMTNETAVYYNFSSIDDFEKVEQNIKKSLINSYRILSKSNFKNEGIEVTK